MGGFLGDCVAIGRSGLVIGKTRGIGQDRSPTMTQMIPSAHVSQVGDSSKLAVHVPIMGALGGDRELTHYLSRWSRLQHCEPHSVASDVRENDCRKGSGCLRVGWLLRHSTGRCVLPLKRKRVNIAKS